MLPESHTQPIRHPSWGRRIFGAKTVQRGGVLRRSVRNVEREIGREALVAEVRARGFHLIECGGQFIIICNPGHIRVIC
jgi:hypothetical protein